MACMSRLHEAHGAHFFGPFLVLQIFSRGSKFLVAPHNKVPYIRLIRIAEWRLPLDGSEPKSTRIQPVEPEPAQNLGEKS